MKTLNDQHDNLTRLVHGQADVVAHTSASLTKNNEAREQGQNRVARPTAKADMIKECKVFFGQNLRFGVEVSGDGFVSSALITAECILRRSLSRGARHLSL